jgi:hypothetical protein
VKMTTKRVKLGLPELTDIPKLLHAYPSEIQKLTNQKRKADLGKLELDKRKLSEKVKTRNPRHLTKEELVLLMQWKLARGKYRPTLPSLIKSNSEENVKRITQEAFKMEWPKSLDKLNELRGVGPATATAILSLIDDSVPFFSDEAASIILQTSKLKYSLKEVHSYVAEMRSSVTNFETEVTCQELEKCLFVLFQTFTIQNVG